MRYEGEADFVLWGDGAGDPEWVEDADAAGGEVSACGGLTYESERT